MNVPNQHSDGQFRKKHNMETQITKDNKQDTCQTNKPTAEYLNHLHIIKSTNDNIKSDWVE
jgi:hypothetical protein